MSKPTSVETFAGGGGFLLGSKAAGFDTRLAVDIDPKPLEVLKDYLPDLNTLTADFLDLSPKMILESAGVNPGELDHFHGSWPCQEFSTTNLKGRKKVERKDDEIYKLLFHMVDTIIALKPKVFSAENVTGAIKGDALRVLLTQVGKLRMAGYNVCLRKVNCLNYGVPQDRVRVLMFGKLKTIPGKLEMPQPPRVDFEKLTVGGAYGLRGAMNDNFGQRFYQPNEFLPTVTATSSLEFLDYDGWRKPTVRELLISQCFPPEYENSINRTKMSYTSAHALIGNAVPCIVAEQLMKYLKGFTQ